MYYSCERLRPELERRIWLQLLDKKYTSNEANREALLATGDKKLIEFARSAAQEGAREHWGGCMKDGELRGDNVMGGYMEETRAALRLQQTQ